MEPPERPLSNGLADPREERKWPLPHTGDVLAPSLILQEKPEGGVDRVVERGLVQPTRDGLFLVKRLGLVPRCDLGFDLRDVRPSKERLVAIGANNPAGRVHAVDAVPSGVENLPAALAGRRFLRSACDHSAEIHSGIIDLHAEACQQVRRYIAPGFVVGVVLRGHRRDWLTGIAALRQKTLG